MTNWTFADVWESIAEAIPDRLAQAKGDRLFTWRDFDRRANAVAKHLLDSGLGHQAKVAAFLYNGPEYLEAYYAAFKASLVPINTNYRYGADELVYLFDNCDAEAVVFHASFTEMVERIRPRLPLVKQWMAVAEPGHPVPDWATDYEAVASKGADRVEGPWGRSGDDLLMLYTGGTTGMPKGVMWRQETLFQVLGGGANLLLELPPIASPAEAGQRAKAALELDPSVTPLITTLAAAPLMHGTAQFTGFGAFTGGGAVATLPSTKFDANELWSEVERLKIGAIAIVGMAFAAPMLDALDANPGRWDLSSLRRIGSSGTVWNAENKAGLLRHLPNIVIFDSLGSSEAVGLASSTSSTGDQAGTAKFMVGPNSAVFTEDGRRVEPGSGERGLLAVGGNIPVGYYKDEEKSAKTFKLLDGQRWSLPGDFATVEADGTIVLLGRGSQCINTGGEKVFPEEVEEALKRFPGVRDAAVVGVPDPRFGERICAVVDFGDGEPQSLAVMAEHVKSQLAGYKAPRELVAAAVQRAPNGKLDYKQIKAQAIAALEAAAETAA